MIEKKSGSSHLCANAVNDQAKDSLGAPLGLVGFFHDCSFPLTMTAKLLQKRRSLAIPNNNSAPSTLIEQTETLSRRAYLQTDDNVILPLAKTLRLHSASMKPSSHHHHLVPITEKLNTRVIRTFGSRSSLHWG